MTSLHPMEVVIIAIVLLAVIGSIAALVIAVAKYTSLDSSTWLHRSMHASKAGNTKTPKNGYGSESHTEEKSLRASDADRDRTISKLREGMTQGRLTITDFDERMASALQAKTLGDLDQLVQDLPSGKT